MVDPSTPSISKHDQISPPSSPIPALKKIPTDDDDCSSSSSFKQSKSTTKRLTLWKHPKETLTHFGSSVKEGILQTVSSYSLSWKQTFVSCLVVTSLLVCHYMATSRSPIYQETTQLWIQCIQESFFWFGCGVLSTVGMGCGMQTGALFLFPHVVEVAVEYTQHQDQQFDLPNFLGLLWTVAIPGFWSGTGSAVGELVPFVFARLMKESGEGDPFSWILPPQQEDGEATTTNTSSSSWWNLPSVFLANTRTTMERQFVQKEQQSFLFWKVFVLALVPNGLFDLCGLVCGASTDISFWVFFGAVWSAKALLRTPLQTCGVAAAIVFISTSSTTDDSETGLFEEPEDTSSSSPLLATLVSFGQFVVSKFLSQQQKEEEESNLVVVFLLKKCWTVVTMVLFGFFLGSMVEQIAQQHYYHHRQEEEGNTTRRRSRQHQHESIKHSSLSS